MFKTEHNQHCKDIANRLTQYANGEIYTCPFCGEHFEDDRALTDDMTWAADIDHDESGAMRCPSCGDWVQFDDWTDDNYAEQATLFDYLYDALDFRVTRSGLGRDGEMLGVEICVAFGGPTIWVDTLHQKVTLNWWNEQGEAEIPGDVCETLNTYIDELSY